MPANYSARVCSKPVIENRRTCSNCGRLGHLVTTCKNQERHHDMIGIEVEGWWHDLIGVTENARRITGSAGARDGSLREISTCNGNDDDDDDGDYDDPDVEDCEDGCDDCPHPVERTRTVRCDKGKTDCRACGARGWEFRTRPGSVGEALRQLTSLYPDVTSRAAGMHVHMSFKEAASVSLLCSEKFFTYWQERWEQWGTKNNVKGAFWERLRDENTYCRKTSMRDWNNPKKNLVSANGGGRYKAINFTSFERHGTVEFRMLPMFQKGDLAVLAIENLVDIVETYLQTAVIDADMNVVTKINGSNALELDPVVNDFVLPDIITPVVTGEVDLDEPFTPGPVLDDQGKPTGVVRMFRYQVDTYLANAASDASKKKQAIGDPKAHKVKWTEFNPNPTSRT